MYILYLEDEANDASLVERYVKGTSHQLHVVSNIDDARHAVQENPDLILIDLLLDQVVKGFDFVQELRQGGCQQPIIAVTGLTLPDEMERCYEVGCNTVLAKPYTIQQLARTIDRYSQ